MDAIKPEDRQKIQAHLAEIWKILYANGLEDLEINRTPNSKQKKRMCEMLVCFNKDYTTPSNGFRLCVSDKDSCWHEIAFEKTPEELAVDKHHAEEAEKWYAIRKRKHDRKEARRQELLEEHHVAYWHKYFMTPYWTSDYSSIRYYKQNEEGTLHYVKPQASDFVRWLYSGTFDGKLFTDDARVKYMKKYGLDKDYDLKTGEKLNVDNDVADAKPIELQQDNAKLAKDYLRLRYKDGSWKKEALSILLSGHEQAIDTYLDTVREFVRQQEEFDLCGLALYGINEERAKAHDAMLEDFGLNAGDEKSNIARDVTKSFDFVGEYKMVCGKMKTVFWSEYEASLRLAYALEVVKEGLYKNG